MLAWNNRISQIVVSQRAIGVVGNNRDFPSLAMLAPFIGQSQGGRHEVEHSSIENQGPVSSRCGIGQFSSVPIVGRVPSIEVA